MKTVLWISRHQMTEDQMQDLERIAGDRLKVQTVDETITDLGTLRPQIEQADLIAAVLPPDLMVRLLGLVGDKPLLRSVAERRPTGQRIARPDGVEEMQYAFVHRNWERLLEMRIRTEDLSNTDLYGGSL